MSTEFDPEAELLEEGAKSEGTVATEAPAETAEAPAEKVETDEEKAAREKVEAEAAAAKKAEAEAAALKLYQDFTGAVSGAIFKEGTEDLLDDVDPVTGTLPESHIVPVKAAYLALPAKSRKAAINYCTEKMQAELIASNVPPARAYLQIQKALEAAKQDQITREPVDPTDAFVELVTAMRLAANFMTPPEGVSADWPERVKTLGQQIMEPGGQAERYKAWLEANEGKADDERTPEPEVHPAVKRAAQLARGRARVSTAKRAAGGAKGPKAPRVSSGTRHNVGEHIREAFENEPEGKFLTVAQIAAFKSKEYGDEEPSQGAIQARLWPTSGKPTKLTFVRPEGPEQGRAQKGAVKL